MTDTPAFREGDHVVISDPDTPRANNRVAVVKNVLSEHLEVAYVVWTVDGTKRKEEPYRYIGPKSKFVLI